MITLFVSCYLHKSILSHYGICGEQEVKNTLSILRYVIVAKWA